jgi:hypothetical protein
MKRRITEAEAATRAVSKELKPARLSVDSLDDQVDSYIMKFEKRATEDKLEEAFRNRHLGFMLEADAQPAPATEKAPKPNLNITKFSKQVARLVMNADSLLDPRTVIINRAANFLSENYDEGQAREMLEFLETHFNITPSNEVTTNAAPPAPPAVGAFGGGGGGA